MSTHPHFMTCPRGFEDLAVAELQRLGCDEVKAGRGGVRFVGGIEQIYAIALWSRLGGRLLRGWAQFDAGSADELYASAMAFDWVKAFADAKTFSIHVNLASNARLGHAQYAMHRLKDAVVDRFAQAGLHRPNVDRERADLVLDLAVHANRATLSIDVIGEPLSWRGLRDPSAPAPLRENLAAALLQRAGWSASSEHNAGRAFVDPMCGSGTILFEAWMMAADRAPGLLRDRWAFESWPEHDPARWLELRQAAKTRSEAGATALEQAHAAFIGSDTDPELLAFVREGAKRIGADETIRVSTRDVVDVRAPGGAGLLLTNPPWGRRLGDPKQVAEVYERLGATLREHFVDWQAAVLVGEAGHGHALGLHAYRRHNVHNGKVDCQLLRIDVSAALEKAKRRQEKQGEGEGSTREPPADLVNRLQKNLKVRTKLAKKLGTDAVRLYDADLPDYNFAVDLYGDQVHVAEYAPPKTIPEQTAGQRRRAAMAAIRHVTGKTREQVHLKRRERQRGKSQYEAEQVDPKDSRLVVREGAARFEVQLEGYLDTGLFLDHRPIRKWLGEHASGARFLNLFCYTASASVHAILGGARQSASVDMSATYLDWAARNYELNFRDTKVDPKQHRLVQDDVISWLEAQPLAGERDGGWDLIFCDPPTFSNSKRMADKFDVQTDHVHLIEACMARLSAGGTLVFSTNYRRFKLDEAMETKFAVTEFGARSIPADFARTPRIHRAFEIKHRG